MEFIGFKIDSNILSTSSSYKNYADAWSHETFTIMSEYDQARAISRMDSLSKLGYNLENNGLAVDRSSAYFGIYSLQEMELYKSDHRYVTFVEIAKNKFDFKDNRSSKTILGKISSGLLISGTGVAVLGFVFDDKSIQELTNFYKGFGIGCDILGLGFAIPALLPTKTKITFDAIYNIYIYDTQTKALIRKEAVTLNVNDEFKGSYTYDEASKDVVNDYLSKLVYNAIFEKYYELNKWLLTQK